MSLCCTASLICDLLSAVWAAGLATCVAVLQLLPDWQLRVEYIYMPEELEPRLHFAEWEQNLLTGSKILELTLKIVLMTST